MVGPSAFRVRVAAAQHLADNGQGLRRSIIQTSRELLGTVHSQTRPRDSVCWTSPQCDVTNEVVAQTHYAADAAFSSRRWEHEPLCLAGTRTDLLEDVMRWSETSGGPRICWLVGVAGTGKSTVWRTLAQEWDDEQLIGSFAFSRDDANLSQASRFFVTLAYQLAYTQPSMAAHVGQAFRRRPNIAMESLREQWKHLILAPITQAGVALSRQGKPLILAIDALDECNNSADIATILRLLSGTAGLDPAPFLVFVTSRPETSMLSGFDTVPEADYRTVVLHEIPDPVVDGDVAAFLLHEFARIRRIHRYIPADWPSKDTVKSVVRKTLGLFVVAATVIRFVADEDCDPPERLAFVLADRMEDESPMLDVDRMYTQLIKYAIEGVRSPSKTDERVKQFRGIVGPIVVLFKALTASALTSLLETRERDVERMVQSLSSVLRYCGDAVTGVIRPFHPSFCDFLLDSRRCQDHRFRIAADDTHKKLAQHCLRLMTKYLAEDMCSLKLPGSIATEVDPDVVLSRLPHAVQYACRFWVEHLQQSKVTLSQGEPLHDEVQWFLDKHLLHWFEALSLIGCLSDGVDMIKALYCLLLVSHLEVLACCLFLQPWASPSEAGMASECHPLSGTFSREGMQRASRAIMLIPYRMPIAMLAYER